MHAPGPRAGGGIIIIIPCRHELAMGGGIGCGVSGCMRSVLRPAGANAPLHPAAMLLLVLLLAAALLQLPAMSRRWVWAQQGRGPAAIAAVRPHAVPLVLMLVLALLRMLDAACG